MILGGNGGSRICVESVDGALSWFLLLVREWAVVALAALLLQEKATDCARSAT